ncbi:MAG: tetratricopeptide repeat protein [Candidatus Acidiferrales bacterium]
MKRARRGFLLAALVASVALYCFPARAGGLRISPEAQAALDKIYSGDPDAALLIVRALQQAQPEHPLGYALEGEALWWKRYCGALETKYGIVDSWKHSKEPEDEAYFKLADKVVHLAAAQLRKNETAEMHVYAGMGYALKARVYALRGENRNVAHAGVSARSEMLRALELDPEMADATGGVGLYNYYVATLSPIVKIFRFFMGIPGGDKELGIKQMEIGMTQGVLLRVDVRYIFAKSLRQYDQKYERALAIAEPLVARYPQNPIFLLLLGNLNAELGRSEKAAGYFQAVLKSTAGDSSCVAHARELATAVLKSLY